MRSGLVCVLLVVLSACLPGAACAQPNSAPTNSAPTVEQIDAALEQLRQDPNLPGTRTERVLRWKDKEKKPEPAKKSEPTPQWLRWIGDFFKWIAEGSRIFVWVLGAVLLLFLLLQLRRFMQERAGTAASATIALPSHVRDLDIRPESLPDDVGAAAWRLWQQGEQRAALSLLYRGALSRLVHAHAVPISAASTEGECVQLANGKLNAARAGFFAQLVQVWQRATYGAQAPADSLVQQLCSGFSAALNVQMNVQTAQVAAPEGKA